VSEARRHLYNIEHGDKFQSELTVDRLPTVDDSENSVSLHCDSTADTGPPDSSDVCRQEKTVGDYDDAVNCDEFDESNDVFDADVELIEVTTPQLISEDVEVQSSSEATGKDESYIIDATESEMEAALISVERTVPAVHSQQVGMPLRLDVTVPHIQQVGIDVGTASDVDGLSVEHVTAVHSLLSDRESDDETVMDGTSYQEEDETWNLRCQPCTVDTTSDMKSLCVDGTASDVLVDDGLRTDETDTVDEQLHSNHSKASRSHSLPSVHCGVSKSGLSSGSRFTSDSGCEEEAEVCLCAETVHGDVCMSSVVCSYSLTCAVMTSSRSCRHDYRIMSTLFQFAMCIVQLAL